MEHLSPNEIIDKGETAVQLEQTDGTLCPSQLSQWLLKNISIKVCHLLNDRRDIDLMLRFMVNKYEEDRFVSHFMLLKIGEAMVRVSTPEPVPTTKVQISR